MSETHERGRVFPADERITVWNRFFSSGWKPVPHPPPGSGASAGFLGLGGVAAFALALVAVQPAQFDVVTYVTKETQGALYLPAFLFSAVLFAAIVGLAVWAAHSAVGQRRAWMGWILAPLILSAPVACYAFVEAVPPFALSFLMVLSAGGAAYRAATRLGPPRTWRWARPVALGSVVLFIIALTIVHTRVQINFFEHFMLGHADFGHFTEELKNCLVGRGLRCDSFDSVRLGWHFVPLMYALAPGYALWPSPVYLMVCGALLVHLPALAAYHLARRLSGDSAIAWMFAVAWLLLPSQSRMVYSNTYGFQWIYFAMPLLAIMITAGVLGHRRTCLVMIVLILLCKETAAAATFGWGLYLVVFTPRRKTGVLVAIGSIVYLILCVKVLIPHYAAGVQYARFDLFGKLGGTLGELAISPLAEPYEFFSRFCRREVLFLLPTLLVPMALLPLRGWRIAIAALPTLLLVLLIRHDQQLSIKFWHQATFLPFLFFAGIASMRRPDETCEESTRADRDATVRERTVARCSGESARAKARGAGERPAVPSGKAVNTGLAAAALVCAAWGHYLYGFSPIAKPYEPIAGAAFLHAPDPRMQTVHQLRLEIDKDSTILASERLAAHFTDYKRIYTGGRIREADYVIIDRRDRWDTSSLVGRVAHFANDPNYRLYGEYGSIIVFVRSETAPAVPLDE